MDDMITAKFPFTVPDPPGRPQVTDWDTSNATLQWEKPVHDGGSKIQGYKIEYRYVMLLHYTEISNRDDSKRKSAEFSKPPLFNLHNYQS